MRSYKYLRLIILILSILIIVLTYSTILNNYFLLIPTILIFIEIFRVLSEFIKERNAKLIEKEIKNTHEGILKTEIESEILKEDLDSSIDRVIEEVEVRKKYERTRILVTKLIENGYLEERVVYSLIEPREFFFIVTYNDPPADDLIKYFPNKRQLILGIIESLGFIKLGSFLGFYLLIPETVNKKFRDITKIRNYIINKFKRDVKEIKNEIKSKDKKLYEKIEKNEDGYEINYTFIISSSKLTDLFMEYYPFNSFSQKFKDYLSGAVNLKDLKKETSHNKHKIKKFILKISNELLLDSIPEKDKILICSDESNLKKEFDISQFTDYSSIPYDNLKQYLFYLLSDMNKAKKYSQIIQNNCDDYTNLLKEMGVSF